MKAGLDTVLQSLDQEQLFAFLILLLFRGGGLVALLGLQHSLEDGPGLSEGGEDGVEYFEFGTGARPLPALQLGLVQATPLVIIISPSITQEARERGIETDKQGLTESMAKKQPMPNCHNVCMVNNNNVEN